MVVASVARRSGCPARKENEAALIVGVGVDGRCCRGCGRTSAPEPAAAEGDAAEVSPEAGRRGAAELVALAAGECPPDAAEAPACASANCCITLSACRAAKARSSSPPSAAVKLDAPPPLLPLLPRHRCCGDSARCTSDAEAKEGDNEDAGGEWGEDRCSMMSGESCCGSSDVDRAVEMVSGDFDLFGFAFDGGGGGGGGGGDGCAGGWRVTRFECSESSRARLDWCCAASVLGLGPAPAPAFAPKPNLRTNSSVVTTCGGAAAAIRVAAAAADAATIGASTPEPNNDADDNEEDNDARDDDALEESGLAPAGPESDSGVAELDNKLWCCCCCIPCACGCSGDCLRGSSGC